MWRNFRRNNARASILAALPAILLAPLVVPAPAAAQASAPAGPPLALHGIGPAQTADLQQAASLVQQGNPAKAEAVLRPYLKSHPNSARALVLLGVAEYQRNQPADSLAQFTRAAKLRKPKASELVIVALDYVKLGELKKADKWITVAVGMQPNDPGAWRYMGGIKYSENRMEEAIAAYQHCLNLLPNDVLSEDGIGRAYQGLGRDPDAEAAYRKALGWQTGARKQFPQPMLHLGGLLVEEGKPQDALPYLLRAEALSPNDMDTSEQLGRAYMALHQYAPAQAALEKAVALSPQNSRLRWLLAEVYRKEGLTEKARAEAKKFSSMLGSHSNKTVP